ncbi:MAG TPA: insulinase family protein, partial [Clostridia bacterium]|nr:insulinase family protein [Clostridia bacterium]
RLREERGLVYSIYSYPAAYVSQGIFLIYSAMKPEQSGNAIRVILDEVAAVKQNLTKEEFENAREQLKGNFFLGLESTSSRMSSLGKSELLLNKVYTPDDIVDRINAVTLEKLEDVINRVFVTDKLCASLVGKVSKISDAENLILDIT